jgi:hypothetical protein
MPNAKSIRQISTILLATTLAGCASVSVKRVTDYNQSGIRYWRPAPYVALDTVEKNKEIACEGTIIMLPDKSEEYAITMNSGLWGNASAKPALDDGWNLTSLDGKVETKTDAGITALGGFLKTVADSYFVKGVLPNQQGAAATTNPDVLKNCSGLVQIEYDPSTGQVADFRKIPSVLRDGPPVGIVTAPKKSSSEPKTPDKPTGNGPTGNG